jgi:dolichyl-phosphate-mannose--protein O-mannosyl transferase
MNNIRPGIFLIISLLFSAAAVSVKWTGLAFPLLIILCHFYFLRREKGFLFACKYVAVILLVYVALFAVHFAVLPNSGDGNAYMTPYFNKTLANNEYANDPSVRPEGFTAKFLELNVRMLDRTASLTVPHQYSSQWYTWPLMLRPIFYWESPENAPNEYVYLLGNPFIYWLGTSTILALFIIWLVRLVQRRKGNENTPALFFILVGFAVNFLPFIFIGRVMFLYHYEAALIMTIMAIAYLIDTIPQTKKKAVTIVIVCLAAATYIFFSPLTYGTPLTDRGLSARMWLSSWR